MAIRIGSGRRDDIVGTNSADLIISGSGADTIDAGAGADFILAGNGNDAVDAGEGNDIVFAGNGSDVVDAGDGDDIVFGGNGRDAISGGAGNDYLDGGNGNDTIDGGEGSDIVLGGRGSDELRGGAGNDFVDGGRGSDRLIYNATDNEGAADSYTGGRGRDTLVLELTAAQMADPALMAEIEAFDARGNRTFTFESLGLAVNSVERLEIVQVDGPVDPEPEPPVVMDETGTVAEGGSNTFDVLANDMGEGLTLAVDGVTGGGSATVTEDGQILFETNGEFEALAEGETAEVTVAYTVTNSDELSAGGTLTVTVTGENDAPEVGIDIPGVVVEEDSEVLIEVPAGAFTDVDGDTLTFSAQGIIRAEVNGEPVDLVGPLFPGLMIDPQTGTVSGTPPPDFNGELIVRIIASDGQGASAFQDVTLTVEAVNDAPEVGVDIPGVTVEEDGEDILIVLPEGAFTDVDGDELTFSAQLVQTESFPIPGEEDLVVSAIVPLPEWLSIDPATGTVTGNPPENFNDEFEIRITATDPAGLSAFQDVPVTVTAVNDPVEIVGPPTFVSLDRGTDENGDLLVTAVTQFTVVDPDEDDTITVSVGEGGIRNVGPDRVSEGPAPNAEVTIDFDVAEDGTVTQTTTYGAEANGFYIYDIVASDGESTDIVENAFVTVYDVIVGTDGEDNINDSGDGRFGTYDLGAGDDSLNTGNGLNIVDAGAGEDFVQGGADGDFLDGGAGSDILFGGAGNDTLIGGEGDDNLDGEEGNDLLTGGAGADVFEYYPGFDAGGTDRITDFESGVDIIQVLTGFVTGDTVVFTAEEIVASQQEQDGEFLYQISGDEFVITNVALTVDDIVIDEPEGPPPPDGPTEGDDVLFGTPNADVIDGLGGDDRIFGLGSDDTLIGGAGNDLLEGGSGSDTLDGGADDDVLIGDDRFDSGDDILTGGSGADEFVFYAGNGPMVVGEEVRVEAAFVGDGAFIDNTDRITDFDRSEGDSITVLNEEFLLENREFLEFGTGPTADDIIATETALDDGFGYIIGSTEVIVNVQLQASDINVIDPFDPLPPQTLESDFVLA